MSFAGSIDAPLEIVGGLVCDMAPAELPLGVSPDCQDCQFTKSAAETRPGLTSIFAAIAGNPTINYFKTYQNLQGVLATLVYDSKGNLWAENSVGVLTSIAAALYSQSPWASSTTLFGREYIAFGDGKIGQDAPRQYDGTNLDRITQGGPGLAPTVVDDTTTTALNAAPNGLLQYNSVAISNLSESGNIVTATLGSGYTNGGGLAVGDKIVVAGVTPAGYNGTFTVASILGTNQITYFNATSGLGNSTVNGTVQAYLVTVVAPTAFTTSIYAGENITISGAGVAGYNATWTVRVVTGTNSVVINTQTNLGNSGGGTIGVAGNIPAGVHGVAAAFLTQQGAITPASPTTTWTAAGGKRALVSGLPVGGTIPSNVVAIVLLFTAAGGASYFYIPPQGTSLPSQVGSTIVYSFVGGAVIDFTDAILLGATSADYLFSEIVLPEVMGVIDYSDRLFWWGERNTLKNWQNLDFCGGFEPTTFLSYPFGWQLDPINGAGGDWAQDLFITPYWGSAYAIDGDGATNIRGMITQSAVKDYLQVPRIQASTSYTVKARVLKTSGLTQGTLHIHLFGSGVNTTGLQVTAAQASTNWQEFTAVLTNPLGAIPSDLVLRVYADGTPTLNQRFAIGQIEIYPTTAPINESTVRASAAESPERIDGVTGLLNVSENNGQAVRAAFKLRGNLYFVKERSLFSTSDNGQEPNTWTITDVSGTVGTPSVRGVGIGEDWAVIASREGLYIFSGGEPQKISQEVGHSASGLTLAWDQINWNAGHTIWVAVDKRERRILVGAPFGASTSPDHILQLDYRDVEGGASEIAGAPPIIISYRGVKIVRDKSRKWSPWTISANHGAMVERFDGTQQMFLGAGAYGNQAPGGNPTGKVYQLDPTKQTDDGAAIPSYYVTAFTPQRETEQVLQLHAHRKLFYYLSAYVEGQGYMNVTAYPENEQNPQLVAQWRLTSPGLKDLESTINVLGERVAFKLAPDATVAGNWFRLQKFCPSMNGDPWSPVRGQN